MKISDPACWCGCPSDTHRGNYCTQCGILRKGNPYHPYDPAAGYAALGHDPVIVADTEELTTAYQEICEAHEALVDAGADPEAAQRLMCSAWAYSAQLIHARRKHRDDEFYPIFPESYALECDVYDEITHLITYRGAEFVMNVQPRRSDLVRRGSGRSRSHAEQ